jgi:uncharacterized protein (TIGR02145 family)
MPTKYICSNNPEHIFNEPTADFWCPDCSIEHRGMLSMFEESEVETPEEEALLIEEPVLKKELAEEPKSEPNPEPIPEPKTIEIAPEPIQAEVIETISIGSQTWMKEYLKQSHIHKYTNLVFADSDKDWKAAHSKKSPAYCYPNNDGSLAKEIGLLFNWYAVQIIAANPPKGFRLPDLDDINLLNSNLIRSKFGFLDGDYGLKMSTPISHRLPMAAYADGNDDRCFWTSEQNVFYTAFSFRIDLDGKVALTRKIDKNAGYFVRCIENT